MAEFTAITTEEAFEEAIAERVKTERESIEKKYEKHISPEDYQKEKGEWDKQKKGYEAAAIKTRIAHEMGLSHDAIEFLKGEDEKSIKASAEKLKGLTSAGGTAPLASHDNHSGADEALRKMLKGLRGE